MKVVYTPRNTLNIKKTINVEANYPTVAQTQFIDKRKEECDKVMEEVSIRNQESYKSI